MIIIIIRRRRRRRRTRTRKRNNLKFLSYGSVKQNDDTENDIRKEIKRFAKI